MAKVITAYEAHDGQLFRSREDAEFNEFSSAVKQDISDFLKQRGIGPQDAPTLARVLCEWELWKMGGYNGWRNTLRPVPPSAPPRQQMQMDLPGLPLPDGALPCDESQGKPPAPPPKPLKPTARPRQRVLVFGLKAEEHARFQQAFGDCFQLALHDSSHPPKISALKACDKIMVMVRFVGFKEMKRMQEKGYDTVPILGEVGELDDKLTALYVDTH